MVAFCGEQETGNWESEGEKRGKGRKGKAQVQDPVWSHFAENRSLVSGSPIRGNGKDWRIGSGEREEGS